MAPDAQVQQLLAGGPLPELFWWVHGPLAHWARTRPRALALANERQRLGEVVSKAGIRLAD